MKKVLKVMLSMCMAATVVFGTGIVSSAAEIPFDDVNWENGKEVVPTAEKSYTIKVPEGEAVKVYLDNVFDHNVDGTVEYVQYNGSTWDGANAFYKTKISKAVCKLEADGTTKAIYFTSRGAESAQSGHKTAAQCDHNYEWITEREATSTEDGLASWKCTKCGRVDSWMATSGYYVFNKDAVAAITKADPNATVTINTKTWESFHKSVLEKLAARPDVTVVINYKYQHKDYTVTIPANADLSKIADSNGFYGFRYLDSMFGGSEIVK